MQALTPTLPIRTRLRSSLGLDGWMVVCCMWLIGGLFLDGWAHINLPQLESFFTPWHGVLYSGFLVTAATLLGVIGRHRRQGMTWRAAVPVGYDLAVLGVFLFALGGMADMVWHTVFGIERSIDALLSPPHLLLAVGGSMLGSGPVQAAWRRPAHSLPPSGSPRLRGDGGETHEAVQGWADLWPMLLGKTTLLSLITFFTMYSHPFGTVWATSMDMRLATLGVVGALLHAATQVGVTLFLLRRWPRLPLGSLTLLTAVPAILLVLIRGRLLMTGPEPLIIAAIAGGMAADGLLWWLRPTVSQPRNLRLFAALAPAALYLCYYLAVMGSGKLGWAPTFWLGSVVQVGLVGWLLSYLVLPPRLPDSTV